MARREWQSTAAGGHDGPVVHPNSGEDSLGELLKRLSSDTGDLLRHELTLAKAEAGEIGANMGRSAGRLAVAAVLALTGAFALMAFAILALGNAMAGEHWLAALILGVLALGTGALLARRTTAKLKAEGLRPQQAIASVKEDARWAAHEAASLKRDLTTSNTATPNRG